MSTSAYDVAYANPVLTLPPSPPRSPTGQNMYDKGRSSSTSPRLGFAAPITPSYTPAYHQQSFQQAQQLSVSQPSSAVNEKFPSHPFLSMSTGMRRNSSSSPRRAGSQPSAPPPPFMPYQSASNAQSLRAIGESSLYKDHADATLSGFIGQLSEKLQNHLLSSTQSSSSTANSESTLVKLIPTASMLKFGGLCILWYCSSAVSNNTGKDILARFRYPVTLTLIQFGIVSFYCVLYCAAREHLSSRSPHQRRLSHVLSHPYMPGTTWWKEVLAACGVKRASKTALHGTLVMSFFQISGHVFSSMATARMPVSTVHTIKVRQCFALCLLLLQYSRLTQPYIISGSFSTFYRRFICHSLPRQVFKLDVYFSHSSYTGCHARLLP